MSELIECTEKLEIREEGLKPTKNHSVKLALVDAAISATLSRITTSKGRQSFPVIDFLRDKVTVNTWIFGQGEETLRDACLKRVSKLIPKKAVEPVVIKKPGKKK